jgi:hypothetical protein
MMMMMNEDETTVIPRSGVGLFGNIRKKLPKAKLWLRIMSKTFYSGQKHYSDTFHIFRYYYLVILDIIKNSSKKLIFNYP